MQITKEFRASMNWFHTWLGIALAGILFVIFWMGTLTVFHLEINKWMMPETRTVVEVDGPLDPIVMPTIESMDLQPESSLFISPANERQSLVRLVKFGGGAPFEEYYLHPETGEVVERTDTLGATGFFYPFHYSLHVSWMGLGYWIVGLAAMAMLILVVSGVFIHRKIIQDFFTFRPKKAARRSTLDLHNMTAMIALPFHVLFPLSGILIFALIYFPNAMTTGYGGDRSALIKDTVGFFTPEVVGEPGTLPESLDSFVERAEAIWEDRDGLPARVDGVRISNAGDAGSIVMVQHAFPPRTVAMSQGNIAFSAATGEIVNDFVPRPVHNTSAWLEGAHFIRFDSWAVRWLFFFGGLAGSAMIATGMLFWMRARIRKGMEPVSVRVVRALTIGTTTGIMVSSAVFLLANRALAPDAAALGLTRAYLEVLAFFAVWIAMFIHAGVRDKRAWVDQCWAMAGVCVLAVALNWATTGGHVINTLVEGQWAVTGVDLTLLAAAACAVYAALHLRSVQANDPEMIRARRETSASEVPAE
ncbi:MAG: PepSY-associated TM helix domain-containing protein [Pseudomonadota bacterium]